MHPINTGIISLVRYGNKRYFRRHELRFAHIDRNHAVIGQFRKNNALGRFNTNFFLIGQTLVCNKTGKTTRSVAALLDLAAVGIENTVTEIYTFGFRTPDHQKLVEPDAAETVSPCRNRCMLRNKILTDRVNHHKIVAQTVHFGKF